MLSTSDLPGIETLRNVAEAIREPLARKLAMLSTEFDAMPAKWQRGQPGTELAARIFQLAAAEENLREAINNFDKVIRGLSPLDETGNRKFLPEGRLET